MNNVPRELILHEVLREDQNQQCQRSGTIGGLPPSECLHREGIDRYEPWVEYEDTEQKSQRIACKEANCERAWLA